MFKSISLTNFRRHTDAVFTFNEGLSVIRAGNEQGKTTIIEAIAYALFGVKALRSSLEEAVTWDCPVNTLKVVLTIDVDGVEYKVSRAKSGAQVDYAGGIVTGQTEVSNFMASKLRVDAGIASKLMFAPQKDIRGALEAGPKATAELIERLSEFGQIDDLIELMQEKLALGSAAQATSKLEADQKTLDELMAVAEPDFAALEKCVTGQEATVKLAATIVSGLRTAYDAEVQRDAKVAAHASEWASLTSRAGQLAINSANATRQLKELREAPVPEVVDADERIQARLQAKADEGKRRAAVRAFGEVHKLLGDAGVERFAGTATQWQTAFTSTQDRLDVLRKQLNQSEVQLAKLGLQKTMGACSFCGQDFSDVPAVIAKNAEVQAEIDGLTLIQENLKEQETTLISSLGALRALQSGGRKVLAAAQQYAEYLDIDDSTYPPTLSWKGPEPVQEDVTPDYDAEVAAIRAGVKAHALYLRKLVELEDAIKTDSRELDTIKARTTEIGAPENAQESRAKVRAARDELAQAEETLDEAKRTLNTRKNTLGASQREWDVVVRDRVRAAEYVEASKAAVANLTFNNALMKAVRAARPAIADQLWNLVLASVSRYFSEMRGTPSTVTKTSDGFLVDGRPAQSFSGSTLDVLGLAIRVALTRTFLPAAPFLVLDEPNAAMDDGRSANVLGFLATVGFKQVIMCSHDVVSESVADQIISFGD